MFWWLEILLYLCNAFGRKLKTNKFIIRDVAQSG